MEFTALPKPELATTKMKERFLAPDEEVGRDFFYTWRFSTPTQAKAACVGDPDFAPGRGRRRARNDNFGNREQFGAHRKSRDPQGTRVAA